jgi:archaellum component FlaC
MYDEIRNVNNELDALKDDLKKGVRHNSAFTRSANDLMNQKEKAVTADGKLSVCVSELNEEIKSLKTKKSKAETDRDYNKRKCKEKLEEEGKPSWYYIF